MAATRAADGLFISGDLEGQRGWLQSSLNALADGNAVEIRNPLPIDVGAVANHDRSEVVIPEASEETPAPNALLDRPRVIPIRSSTPVTALRAPVEHPGGRGDGLGALRGRVAHRAIEERYTARDPRGLPELVREEADRPLDSAQLEQIADDVSEMLERFDASPLARELREADSSWFELPFAFDWERVSVHGAIDLVYRLGPDWHVVDFKTDRIDGRDLADVAAPYLTQLGLYGQAVARATRVIPELALCFLRSGEMYELDRPLVDEALAANRAAVSRGDALIPNTDGPLELAEGTEE